MSALEVVEELGTVVSLPAAAVRVCALAQDPATTAAMFESVILTDVALTARLLRVANSPALGLATKVTTVSRAVTVLGMGAVRDLAVGIAAVHSFARIPSNLVTMESFWTHSMLCGIAARELAARGGRRRQAETAFVEGLLHDVGVLLLFRARPDESREALLQWADDPGDSSLLDWERRVLGFDHCEVGAELARRWHLPPQLQSCIAFYPQPERAAEHGFDAAIVCLADRIATLAQIESTDLEDAGAVPDSVWRLTGARPDWVPDVLAAANGQLDEVRALLA